MMDKPWKLVLLLVGIFAAGMVAGGFVTVRFGRQMMPRRAGPELWGANRLKNLTEHLDLTPDQQEKLRPIIAHDTEDLKRIRSTSINETRRILDRMEQDITAVLTPEQRPKFEQMNRDMRDRMQRLMKDRGPGGGQHPHDALPGETPLAPAVPPPDKPPGG